MHAARLTFAGSLCVMACLAAGAGAEDVAQAANGRTDEQPPPTSTEVLALKHAPVLDVAQAIRQMLAAEGGTAGLALVPEPVSNSLIVSGTASSVQRAVGLVKALDARPAAVTIELLVAETDEPKDFELHVAPEAMDREQVAALLQRRGLKVTYRAQLVTLSNQPGLAQFGSKQLVGGGGRGSRETVYDAPGLTFGVTPRVSPGGPVLMEADLKIIHDEQPAAGAKRPSTVIQTTLTIDDGKTVLMGSVLTRGETSHELRVLVTARITGGG